MLNVLTIAFVLGGLPAPIFPDEAAPQRPGQLRVEGPRTISSANLDDASTCGGCHMDIAAQWRTSAHALASFSNPVYRVTVERIRDERGLGASRMCAACHDLALLTSGAMELKDIAPDDPRAHAGVSCTSCHSAVHATRDGNGSLTLRSDEVFPTRKDESTLEKHRARVASPLLRTAELCASCHRAFLDDSTGNASAFFGMDDYGAWQRSAWAGSTAERPDHVKQQDCRQCHMAREKAVLGDVAAKDGTVPSHRFLGAHTYLSAMRGDQDNLKRVQAFLEKAVTVDVGAARVNGGDWQIPAERARVKPGDSVELDVVVFNENTGHRFPGGVLDNQGAVIELEVLTAQGRVLATSREHQLRSQLVDKDGVPLQRRDTHEFVTAVWNHTVASREARVARLRVEVPKLLADRELPLRVKARVAHVARLAEMAEMACADSKTPRGQAFRAAYDRLAGQSLDPCVPQPRTVVAESSVTLDGKVRDDAWLRAYRRGLGLALGLQEYLDDAELAFKHALARAPANDREARATVSHALGRLAAQRGQVDDALRYLAEAEAFFGVTAATAKARGEAFAQVWRWPQAASAFSEAVRLAPADLLLWQALAMAEASAGHWAEALAAAQKGLELHPRDGDCMRVQALSLERLGAPPQVVSTALDTALHWRVPDNGPRAKALCSAKVPGCANRRNPVPRYDASPSNTGQ